VDIRSGVEAICEGIIKYREPANQLVKTHAPPPRQFGQSSVGMVKPGASRYADRWRDRSGKSDDTPAKKSM